MRPTAIALAAALCGPVGAAAEEPEPVYIAAMDAEGRRGSIGRVRSEAHVTASDGLEYDVVTFFQGPQRAAFHRRYPDRDVTLGVDGRYYWSFDGQEEEEGPSFWEEVTLGHQFHAQLLFFDRLHGPLESSPDGTLGSRTGRRLLRIDEGTRRPRELVYRRPDAADVRIAFEDWRDTGGIVLPFHLVVDDGERTFDYRFRSVSFNEGSMDDFRAPVAVLTDEQHLLRLHRQGMDAHLVGDVDLMGDSFGEEAVILSQGQVHQTTGAEVRAMLEGVFSTRRYTRYDDLIRPIVRVSEDGTLGWVVVQVAAEGVRRDDEGTPSDPFAFTSAWVSLFQKSGARWTLVGNVSNFAPEEP